MDLFMEAIEARRKSAGLKQTMVADALGISPQAYSNYQTESRSPAKLVVRHFYEYCEKNPEIMDDFVNSFFDRLIDEYARVQYQKIEAWRKSA